MPHIAVTMYPGRDEQIKMNLAKILQQTVVDTLGVNKNVVTVSIEDVDKEKWSEHLAQFKDKMYTT